ncbi:hypothetical protein [Couchioplanes azureus]|uniref:hypothetical protein n=1 Tax=Couchioplanes caeruleus TaxID=56438 RepID=UPI001670B346|nr:hypothetical protein [Couchioplanes caeruleus]
MSVVPFFGALVIVAAGAMLSMVIGRDAVAACPAASWTRSTTVADRWAGLMDVMENRRGPVVRKVPSTHHSMRVGGDSSVTSAGRSPLPPTIPPVGATSSGALWDHW